MQLHMQCGKGVAQAGSPSAELRHRTSPTALDPRGHICLRGRRLGRFPAGRADSEDRAGSSGAAPCFRIQVLDDAHAGEMRGLHSEVAVTERMDTDQPWPRGRAAISVRGWCGAARVAGIPGFAHLESTALLEGLHRLGAGRHAHSDGRVACAHRRGQSGRESIDRGGEDAKGNCGADHHLVEKVEGQPVLCATFLKKKEGIFAHDGFRSLTLPAEPLPQQKFLP